MKREAGTKGKGRTLLDEVEENSLRLPDGEVVVVVVDEGRNTTIGAEPEVGRNGEEATEKWGENDESASFLRRFVFSLRTSRIEIRE
jgi:hypothetical protein